jgi:hypothetical protein
LSKKYGLLFYGSHITFDGNGLMREFSILWLGSDVVVGVSDAILRKFEVGGDLSESAWLKVGERNILVGNSATSYSSSFAADKVQIAAYQVATALGLAAIATRLSEYQAAISLRFR